MRANLFVLSFAAAAALTSPAANATRYTFDLTGSRHALFELESSKPSNATAFQTQFYNVSGYFAGAPSVANTISFGAVFFISALDISGTQLGFAQFSGDQLFTGPTSDPVFNVGTFQLSGIVSGNSTITITAAPVSEPGSLVLLAGAVGAAAYAATRRTRPAS